MDATKTIYLNIAGFNIKMLLEKTDQPFYYLKFKQEITTYYQGFILKEKVTKIDYSIVVHDQPTFFTLIKPQSKEYYIEVFKKNRNNTIDTTYKINIFELQLIFKEIILILLKGKGFFFHGSSVVNNKKATIFTAKSGGGKSTAMALLQPEFPALTDDMLIIKREKKDFYLFQTPFIEKNYWIKRKKEGYLIDKIYFLKKASFFQTKKVKNKNLLLKKIIKQFWTEKSLLKFQLKTLFDFVANFDSFYDLCFAKDKVKFTKFIYEI